MLEKELEDRLQNLEKKIHDAKEKYEFHEHYHDGHRLTWPEIVRHHEELSEKIKSDLDDYKEKHGHLTALEERVLVFFDSRDD